MSSVNIYNQDVSYTIKNKKKLYAWLKEVASSHGCTIKQINYILCNNKYLLGINIEFLNHDALTDVITFPYNEQCDSIEADIFISIEMVKENAGDRNLKCKDELNRVMVHGLLHLLGYGDKSEKEKKRMRQKEDYFLSLRKF